MSRASVNACVKSVVDGSAFSVLLKEKIRAVHGTMEIGCEEYGMTVAAVYDRLKDPDRWTVGQLRELRLNLGMSKQDFVAALRPLL